MVTVQLRECAFLLLTLAGACGGIAVHREATDAATDLAAPYRTDGACVANIDQCPRTFDLALAVLDCGATSQPANEVGTCDGYLTFHIDSSAGDGYHLPDSPYWMCFYDPRSGTLLGQRHCAFLIDACDATSGCVETLGTPTCQVYTRTSTTACADAAVAPG
jgi:hypothetical protein